MAVRAAITSMAALLALIASSVSGQDSDPQALWAERTAKGIAAAKAGQHSEALAFFRAALMSAQSLDANDPRRATAMSNLGLQRLKAKDFEGSGQLLSDALALRRRLLGDEHGAVADSHVHLAAWHEAQGRYERAELALTRALVIREKLFGPGHPDSLAILDRQMIDAAASGRLDDAIRFARRALASEPIGGEQVDIGEAQSENAAQRRRHLAALLAETGKASEAEPLLRQTLALDDTAAARIDLANLLVRLERFEDAVEVLKDTPDEAIRRQLIQTRLAALSDEAGDAVDTLDGLIATVGGEADVSWLGEAYYIRALANRRLERFERAQADLDAALSAADRNSVFQAPARRAALEALLETQNAAGDWSAAQDTRAQLESLAR